VPQSLAALVSTGCDLKDREKILIIDVGFRLVQMTVFENFEILASCFHLVGRDSQSWELKILEKIDAFTQNKDYFQTHKDISKIYLIGGGINHVNNDETLKTRLTKTIPQAKLQTPPERNKSTFLGGIILSNLIENKNAFNNLLDFENNNSCYVDKFSAVFDQFLC